MCAALSHARRSVDDDQGLEKAGVMRWTGQMGQMGSAAISMSLLRYSTCTYQVPGRSGSVPASAPARARPHVWQAGRPAGRWQHSERRVTLEWDGDTPTGSESLGEGRLHKTESPFGWAKLWPNVTPDQRGLEYSSCMRWSISRMRWNWMGQLLGQSLQHGANWKGMSAVEGAGAGAADADAANAANAANAAAPASHSAVLRPSRQSCDGGASRASGIGDTWQRLGLLGLLGQLGRRRRQERREGSPKGSQRNAKPPNAPPAAHPWLQDPGSCSSPCWLLGSWEILARCPRDFDKMSERWPDKLQLQLQTVEGHVPFPAKGAKERKFPVGSLLLSVLCQCCRCHRFLLAHYPLLCPLSSALVLCLAIRRREARSPSQPESNRQLVTQCGFAVLGLLVSSTSPHHRSLATGCVPACELLVRVLRVLIHEVVLFPSPQLTRSYRNQDSNLKPRLRSSLPPPPPPPNPLRHSQSTSTKVDAHPSLHTHRILASLSRLCTHTRMA
ncbi:hypothetical protein BGZ57DRAFT_847511 [Hyaloscypha finlandica]|nr:hypothetical protein BGZ57DRAFT_847511 [Hyaloscypha finlandica]